MIPETTTSHNIELKVPTTIKALIEALIFAAQEPLSVSQIRSIYQGEGKRDETRQLDTETIRALIAELNAEYEKTDRPYRIITIAGGYQFATRSEYAEWLGRLHKEQGRRKLSQSGIETLAIIAYKQPITKAEIEKIRGVNCDYVLKTLLEKELITVTGRAETVGRPLLYGTTKEFLKHFGLNDITDLPRPREIEEILGESQFETERRMLEAQAGAEAMKKEQEDFKSRLPHIPKKKVDLEQKEAHIVSRKRVREIRIVPRTELENPQQEKIEFPTETCSSPNDKGTVSDESTTTPPPHSPQPENVPTGEISPLLPSLAHRELQNEVVETEPPPQLPKENLEVTENLSVEISSFVSEAIEEKQEEIVPTLTSFSSVETPTTEKEEKKEFTNESAEHNNAEEVYHFAVTTETQEETPTSDSQTPRTRWQLWKEKIQGFIRKLFD